MSDPTPPPGFIRLDNLGDPVLVRVSCIAAVYRAVNGRVTTRVVLHGVPSVEGDGPIQIHVSESVDEVGAAIAEAAR